MSPELRRQVRERAGGRCEYCRLPDWIELAGPFHVEHVIARQHRGLNVLSNLAWACSRCNRHKGTNLSGVDPDGDVVVTLFNPRCEHWQEHFELVCAIIRGRTSSGRATAWLLQMNAERRVELRSQLIAQGLWQS
jgi:hypothetical protein